MAAAIHENVSEQAISDKVGAGASGLARWHPGNSLTGLSPSVIDLKAHSVHSELSRDASRVNEELRYEAFACCRILGQRSRASSG